MIFNEQEIKFLKLNAKWVEDNKRVVIREEVIKELHIDGDTYEVLVQTMLHEEAIRIDPNMLNMRDGRFASFRPLAKAVELVREIEAAENIKSKPPEILQKILWIIKYGIKYWWLVLLAVLILLLLYILPRINLFSKDHQNIRPKAETSSDSSNAIITSGPNSPVTVHYRAE